MQRFVGLAGALIATLGCGDDPTGESGETTVTFRYEASTTTDPAVATANPGCVGGVGRTHIHPSWRGFARVDMTAASADEWTISLTDVPVGVENRIRISDPNTFADNPTGASTEGVFANGVRLTRVVDTPGSGIEPGLAFQADADGRVTP